MLNHNDNCYLIKCLLFHFMVFEFRVFIRKTFFNFFLSKTLFTNLKVLLTNAQCTMYNVRCTMYLIKQEPNVDTLKFKCSPESQSNPKTFISEPNCCFHDYILFKISILSKLLSLIQLSLIQLSLMLLSYLFLYESFG